MPSRQPRQLVFNCTWEDQLETAGWAFSVFNVNEAAALDICVRESCKVTLMIYLQWVAGTAENQTTANQFVPTRSHREEPRCPLLTNIAFILWFLFLHSLVLPFASPHLFFSLLLSDCVKAVALEARGGSWCLTKGGFFLCQGRQRCEPTQLHCEPQDCVISIIHCSLFPQSILRPAAIPRFGRKCSLKASPPTTEAQRSQSAAKKYSPIQLLQFARFLVDVHACGWMCLHSKVFFMSASQKNPNTLPRLAHGSSVKGVLWDVTEGPRWVLKQRSSV